MFLTFRVFTALLLMLVCNLNSCFCVRDVFDEDGVKIARVVRKIQTDLANDNLNYEICSDFAVRVRLADHDGCFSIIKICMCREIARICHPEISCAREDGDDDAHSTDYHFLKSIPVFINSSCGKRIIDIIGSVDWFQAELPRLRRLSQIPEDNAPALLSLRKAIERVLLQRLADTIGHL